MKNNMEKSKNPAQGNLNFRTEEEITQSIREKRANSQPLDSEEQALIDKQIEEDREDRNNAYPH